MFSVLFRDKTKRQKQNEIDKSNERTPSWESKASLRTKERQKIKLGLPTQESSRKPNDDEQKSGYGQIISDLFKVGLQNLVKWIGLLNFP